MDFISLIPAIPTEPIALIGYIVAIILLALRFWDKHQEDSQDIVEDSNQLLRDLVSDQQTKITALEASFADMQKKMTKQEQEIQLLKEQNMSLEKIIRQALSEFFIQHPKITAKIIREMGRPEDK